MNRLCPSCGLRSIFYKMRGHLIWIYCSMCCHEMRVSKEEASWYDEDNEEQDWPNGSA